MFPVTNTAARITCLTQPAWQNLTLRPLHAQNISQPPNYLLHAAIRSRCGNSCLNTLMTPCCKTSEFLFTSVSVAWQQSSRLRHDTGSWHSTWSELYENVHMSIYMKTFLTPSCSIQNSVVSSSLRGQSTRGARYTLTLTAACTSGFIFMQVSNQRFIYGNIEHLYDFASVW